MSKLKNAIVLVCCMLSLQLTYAQEEVEYQNHLSSEPGIGSFGIGMGLPYGGIGGRLGVNMAKGLNFFAGFGYQFTGLGYNFGLRQDFPSKKMAQFYLTGMYGTNAGIKIEGTTEFDKLYSGLTFGLGVKANSFSREGNYWDIGLLVPVRSSDFSDDWDALSDSPIISDLQEPWPILLVVGYNFSL